MDEQQSTMTFRLTIKHRDEYEILPIVFKMIGWNFNELRSISVFRQPKSESYTVRLLDGNSLDCEVTVIGDAKSDGSQDISVHVVIDNTDYRPRRDDY